MTDNPQQSRDLASKDQLLEEFVAAAVAELRGHRYCGDAYPQNGWPGVNAALAKYEAWRRAVETKAAPRDFMRLSTPWPLPDVLRSCSKPLSICSRITIATRTDTNYSGEL